ncbi:lytic transglycosylase domain-containing protein [Consotaella salsifontis]|uniref:Soluble lytic murein transglycosylase n=1 Tax=Consotaella salsifontis TaxID=1365950 RepID=A0A1T4T640_9HYPH|nr:lytic transglycosylase domain-containing protein [Consotaella salsifontis]SKA35965.1 soluble lytic murein transglycosylase [Consotaella salsifontis]
MSAKALTRLILRAGMLASLATPCVAAEVQLPAAGPIPTARPYGNPPAAQVDPARFGGYAVPANPLIPRPAPAPMARPAQDQTASIASFAAPRSSGISAMAGNLHSGLDALNKEDVVRARSIREGLLPGSLDRHILSWAIALHGGPDVPSYEIASTARELADWPGMKTLRANSERAIYRERPDARTVIAAFANSRPETAEGAMALARAFLEVGQAGKAKALVSRVWREDDLDTSTESAMLQTFGSILTQADHKYRMDRLLYADRVTQAGRVAKLANAESLYSARAAAIRGDKNTPQLLSRASQYWRSDPGFLFAQVEYLRKAGKTEEAARVLQQAPRDAAQLIDPDAWWNERRIVSRDLIDDGDPRTAYRVAASHSAENSSEAAEAEFHAGWYALRFLRDPATASRHFAQIARFSTMPLSLSRAYYWQGRAAEAGGPGNARSLYAQAARFGTTFYGQLAAARLGARPADVVYPSPSDAERRRFASREPVQAIKRLESVDYDSRATLLYRGLADELTNPGELALLSAMAERRGDHYLSLRIGKQASWRGIDAPALAFPVGVIPSDARISAAGKALAYAIARQESEFRADARSPAGALGLLQLLPGTAKTMAQKVGVPYSLARLSSDAGYNATLGSQYLGQQIDDFGGSYILTFIAYNAGPRRAREWVERFGDPRGKSLDEVIDWIERIPFTETRNYVQRVMENYEVYKMRLGAGFDIERDLRFGRAG